jgi:hypothetical protein
MKKRGETGRKKGGAGKGETEDGKKEKTEEGAKGMKRAKDH